MRERATQPALRSKTSLLTADAKTDGGGGLGGGDPPEDSERHELHSARAVHRRYDNE